MSYVIEGMFQYNLQNVEQEVLDLPSLVAYISYARKHIHPQISDEAAEDLTRRYVEMRKRGNTPGSRKKVMTSASFLLFVLNLTNAFPC